MSLDVLELIRHFLQHVLPPGFMKVRHFGFMSSNYSVRIDAIAAIILQQSCTVPEQPEEKSDSPTGFFCPDCGGPLILVKRMGSVLWDTA